jgi:hypothetical protein
MICNLVLSNVRPVIDLRKDMSGQFLLSPMNSNLHDQQEHPLGYRRKQPTVQA